MNLHKNPQLTSRSEHKILNISQKTTQEIYLNKVWVIYNKRIDAMNPCIF